MSDTPQPGQDVALMRLVGGLLAAGGLMIALLCGGCAVEILASPGGLAWALLPLVVGGAPAVVGLMILRRGARLMQAAPLVPTASPPAEPPRRAIFVAGWTVVALGGLLDAFAAVKIVASALAIFGGGRDPQGLNQVGGFILAFGYTVMFLLGAALIEGGRQILRAARPAGVSPRPLDLG